MQNSKKKLLLYAAILVPVCCLLYAAIIVNGIGINGGSVLALALMWVPGLAALAAKLFIDHTPRGLGWRLSLHGLRYLGAAYLIPLGLCLAVYNIAWVTGVGTCRTAEPTQLFIFASFGVLISMAASLGEEIGWRGLLLTELRKLLPPRRVHLVIGVVWFLYHAPLIVFSDYNNGNVLYSLVCFGIMVLGFTVLADTLCIRADSLWPAVLLHASHNVFVQSIFDPLTANGSHTQYLTSEFGIGLALGYALVALVILRKEPCSHK